jgi:nucleotide-binding universal stress UspA family protein
MAISHIVAPVDFSPASRRALDEAIELASACGAKLDIIHAVEVLTYRGVEYKEVMKSGTYEDDRQQAAEDLEEWAAIARDRGVEPRCQVVEGDARRAIIEYANEVGADLIVLGAKGHSRLLDLLVGSVASSVAHNAKCSVHLVR